MLRAIAERNIKVEDLRKGMGYLQNGFIAGILNTIQPGSVQQLHSLFSDIIKEKETKSSNQPQLISVSKGNPFPALK